MILRVSTVTLRESSVILQESTETLGESIIYSPGINGDSQRVKRDSPRINHILSGNQRRLSESQA
ncbi:MAG: hypothetical protein LBH04_00735 [Tannerellaceae bacterium]|nr:hypothetical protein [Tannerellaceae bacterium]